MLLGAFGRELKGKKGAIPELRDFPSKENE
jgi:hypothetical protein